jgi:hypothetical protein
VKGKHNLGSSIHLGRDELPTRLIGRLSHTTLDSQREEKKKSYSCITTLNLVELKEDILIQTTERDRGKEDLSGDSSSYYRIIAFRVFCDGKNLPSNSSL